MSPTAETIGKDNLKDVGLEPERIVFRGKSPREH